MTAQRFSQGNLVHVKKFQGKRNWKKEKQDKKCDHRKGKSHTVDQCFKIIDYPEWYNAMKSARSYSNRKKFATNVHMENEQDSQVDMDDNIHVADGTSGSQLNSEMMNSFCQEFMKVMQAKQPAQDQSNSSFASIAGSQVLLLHLLILHSSIRLLGLLTLVLVIKWCLMRIC